VRWMHEVEEVAKGVARRCLDFVSRAHVNSL
jgi:hypothetical protein